MPEKPKSGQRPYDAKAHDKHYLSLGRFIDSFAKLESMMQYLLWKKAGVSEQIAQSIFSGVRLDTARDFVRRIREAKRLKDSPLLTSAFLQIGIINQTRNDLVHYGAEHVGGVDFLVSNKNFAHTESRIRSTNVTETSFHDMQEDIVTILMIIVLHLENDFPDREKSPKMEPIWALALRPWQYKPERQGSRDHATLPPPQALPPPPES
jgi:hypothetical protein